MPPTDRASELRIEAQRNLDMSELCRMRRLQVAGEGAEAARRGLPTNHYSRKWRMFAEQEAMYREKGEVLNEEATRLEASDETD